MESSKRGQKWQKCHIHLMSSFAYKIMILNQNHIFLSGITKNINIWLFKMYKSCFLNHLVRVNRLKAQNLSPTPLLLLIKRWVSWGRAAREDWLSLNTSPAALLLLLLLLFILNVVNYLCLSHLSWQLETNKLSRIRW